MYNTIKFNLLNNWSVVRWIRFAISIVILVQAVIMHDMILGFLGSFFMFQTLTNTGCCAGGACAPKVNNNNNSNQIEDVEFTEIKNK